MDERSRIAAAAVAWIPGPAIYDDDGNRIDRGAPEPCPELLDEEQAIRYLQLDDVKGQGWRKLQRIRAMTIEGRPNPNRLQPVMVGSKRRYRRERLDQWLRRQEDVKPC